MTIKELLHILSDIPDEAEVIVDLGERYADIKDINLEYAKRSYGVIPHIIITLYL